MRLRLCGRVCSGLEQDFSNPMRGSLPAGGQLICIVRACLDCHLDASRANFGVNALHLSITD